MGRTIERVAAAQSVDVTAIFDGRNPPIGDQPDPDFDVAIEFSTPEAVVDNIAVLAGWGKPIVVGTTGWSHRIDELTEIINRTGGRLVHGSNFSLGVNLFFQIVREAARLVNFFDIYDVAVSEIHHTGKADAPSGTALELGDIVLDEISRKTSIVAETMHRRIDPESLHVASQRLGSTPGTHTVSFDSVADTIELIHRARNRDGFALGSLLAARWILDRDPGVYEFEEIFSDASVIRSLMNNRQP